jgi:hypothetical protein
MDNTHRGLKERGWGKVGYEEGGEALALYLGLFVYMYVHYFFLLFMYLMPLVGIPKENEKDKGN